MATPHPIAAPGLIPLAIRATLMTKPTTTLISDQAHQLSDFHYPSLSRLKPLSNSLTTTMVSNPAT